MNVACNFFLHALRVFVMRALEKTREHEQAIRKHCYEYCVQFLFARVASICNACTGKNSKARASYSGALL